jgi:hypothetical protein
MLNTVRNYNQKKNKRVEALKNHLDHLRIRAGVEAEVKRIIETILKASN